MHSKGRGETTTTTINIESREQPVYLEVKRHGGPLYDHTLYTYNSEGCNIGIVC